MPAGRPNKPESERRTHRFQIRLSEAERELIEAAAEAKDQTASDWARTLLLKAAKRQTGS
ncbi:MAG: hypothetical protein AAGE65_05070 [Planctomycetota bacterium]